MTSQPEQSPNRPSGKNRGRGKNPARRVAANMLAAILRGKTLDEARDRLQDLNQADRNLADAIVQTALRHFGTLEKTLKTYVKKMPPRASPARALLFIGAAQILHMNVPRHAALNETVAATGRREQPYRGMINAVLRNLTRDLETGQQPSFPIEDNLPDWLRDNWLAAHGAEATHAMAAALAHPPALDLCFKSAQAAQDYLTADIEESKAEAVSPTHIRLSNSLDVTKLEGFKSGDFWVQNAAAGQPALRLNKVLSGPSHVLDLCAAPGGKTMQLAAAGHRVTALDVSATRLARLEENLARTQLSAELLCAEAADWLAQTDMMFDGILLDAPCTATGTLRRHPDILLHRHPSDMEKLMVLQASLLQAALARVKPGGYLAYGVCAVQPQEGREQIDRLLATNDRLALQEDFLSLPDSAHGNDGFYAALLRKR